MNVHHLELFHYVAKHGGVSAAARRMPYGIQQPAISAQILQLEDALGVTLFQRRPFKLTHAGADLFAFIEPFFGGLEEIGDKLRGGGETRLRISCPEIVQREYLPVLFTRVRARVPGFQFSLFSGREEEIECQLREQTIDIGLTTLFARHGEGLHCRELLRVPMVLLVPERSRITEARQIWERDRIDLPLITFPSHEPVCRLFQQELQQRKLDWYPALEVSSLDLVSRYVAANFGVGLSLAPPAAAWPKNVRVLPLDDFPAVAFGALWIGKPSPLAAMFLAEAEKLAGELEPPLPSTAKAKPRAQRPRLKARPRLIA